MTNTNSLLTALTVGLLCYASPVSAEVNLLHRWSFNDSPGGTNVADSVGSATGTLRVARTNGVPQGAVPTLDGSSVVLDGVGGYVDLPNGIISSLTNITIEFWVTWDGGDGNQRLFDFGSMETNGVDDVEDPDGSLANTGDGDGYIFATPDTGTAGDPDWMRFGATSDIDSGYPVPPLIDPLEFLTGTETHIVCVYGQGWMRMFYGDALIAIEQTGASYNMNQALLSAINDVNNWIGRSQWGVNDPYFGGSFNEFRIHGSRLTAQEIRASWQSGPDVVSYDPGAATSVTMSGVANNMVVGNIQQPAFSATFAGIGSLALESDDLDSLSSSDTNVVSIDAGGRLVAVGPGVATVTAMIDAASDSEVINVSASNPTLENRWSFNESPGSATVIDSVGGQHGTVVASSTTNVTLTGSQVSFPGGPTATAPYIDLPDGIISSKANVTVEVWWSSPTMPGGSRIFDFGSSTKTNANDGAGTGLGYMILSPNSSGGLRAVTRTNENGAYQINSTGTLPTVDVEHHVAYVFAPDSLLARLYLDGVVQDTDTAPFPLSLVPDTNNWLGLSQWGQDPGFNGSINELRIYEGVLSDLDIALHRHAGPDVPTVSDPGDLVSLSVPDLEFLVGDSATSQAILLATFQNYTDVEITGVSGVFFESEDTNIFTTTSGGLVSPNASGMAALVGSYGGLSATGNVTVLPPVSVALAVSGPLYVDVPRSASVVADFTASITNVDVSGFDGVSYSSSDTNVATISATGRVVPLSTGPVTLEVGYGGQVDSLVLSVAARPGGPNLIDDFDLYDLGDVRDTANPPWTEITTGTSLADIEEDSGNQFLSVGWTGGFRGAAHIVPAIADASTAATLYYEAYAESDSVDHAFGLSDFASGWSWFSDFEAYAGITENATVGLVNLVARNGGANQVVSSLNVGQWYSIRLVVNNSANTYDVYRTPVGQDATAGDLVANDYAFRNGGTNDLVSVMATGYLRDQNVRIDNVYLYDGVHLEAPSVAGPTLSVSRSGSDVIISWPTSNGAGFVLEGTTVLGTGVNWDTNGIPAPAVVGDQYQVTLPSPSGMGYYRLKQ